jgi:enamine deaminase RidA (YjgF/YER057c/UK114 family)
MTMTRLSPGPRMSEAVTIGDIVFLAGQVPDDLTADITGQTQQVLANIDAVLAQLGGTKADIASVQVWLADMADFVGMNAVWDARVDRRCCPCPQRDAGRDDRGRTVSQNDLKGLGIIWTTTSPRQWIPPSEPRLKIAYRRENPQCQTNGTEITCLVGNTLGKTTSLPPEPHIGVCLSPYSHGFWSGGLERHGHGVELRHQRQCRT